MLRTLVKYLLSSRDYSQQTFAKFVQKLNSAQTCFKKKKAPKSTPSAHVSGRFVFLTDVFNLIQDFYCFFILQIINGKLVIVSSP